MHNKEITEVFEVLHTSEEGLTSTEAQQRLKQYGYNELKKEKRISKFKIFISQFNSILVYILIAATVISMLLKEFIDGFAILTILIINSVLGFIQEYRAEKAIEALKKLASLKSKVFRDGKTQVVNTIELVPGDVIFLETGDKVPADSRIIFESNLETMEASLTGESTPVEKSTAVLSEITILAERKNMVYAGTVVTKGRAKVVVVGTGMQTEIGKIAQLLEETDSKLTPLQKRLAVFGRWMGLGTIIICAIVFVISLLRLYYSGESFTIAHALDLFLVAIALAVAAVPEGLPIVVTISLALGVKRMIKRNALIRKLPSVETLGSTTVICSDKTGTLTKNEMTVQRLYVNDKIINVTGIGYKLEGQFLYNNKATDPKEVQLILTIGALNNDAVLENGKVLGDPTEGCLIVSAEKLGLNKKELNEKYPRIKEIPFDSVRKRMTTIHLFGNKKLALVKGAPDSILPLCSYVLQNNKLVKLNSKIRQKINFTNEHLAESALRTLAFAYREVSAKELQKSEHLKPEDIEKELVFVGLQGMIDPPREEVKEAIARCKTAGIKVVMITGDHEITARAIAKELGIEGDSVTGKTLHEINLEEIVENIGVYARVNPEDKMKIIEAFHKKGHVVAMTGDGVNDAPALKGADLGIAMGITGTDVAKEASHMVLTDDNFASIVNAVEEGRGIYDNIRKFLVYLLSCNITEVLIIFLSIILGMPLPLVAIQLLLVNLVTDGLPATSLAADPFEPGAMQRKPIKNSDSIFKGLYRYVTIFPLLLTAVILFVFRWFLSYGDIVKAQTAVFLVLALSELYVAFSCRSLRYSLFKAGVFKNKWLFVAVLASLCITLAVIYIPALQGIFDTTSLSLMELLTLFGVSVIGFIYLELHKVFARKTGW